MSAYIVEDKTINKVLSMLSMDREHGSFPWINRKINQFFNIETEPGLASDILTALGQLILDLNYEAVNDRYTSNETVQTVFKLRLNCNVVKIQALKALDCILYQCSEGDCTETPVYQLMEKIANAWRKDIINKLPAYDTSEWG